MKLKKFTLTNILISSIIILGIYFISNVTRLYDDELLKFKKYLNLKNNTVKIVNLGSSHGAYGIYFPLNVKEEMNLALSSQSLYYDLQLIKKYENRIKENAIVIIPISIFSFYSHFNEEINKRYVHLLEKKNILGIDNKTYFLTKNFSILYPPTTMFEKLRNLKNNDTLILGIRKSKNLKLEERKRESISTVQGHLGIFNKEYSVKNAEKDFINLITYIESKKWNYVLITTPFSYLYNENIEKYQKGAFKERIYDNIKEVEKKLGTKFIYLDYSHDSRFENNLEYFFDDDHLNEKGAKYFTEILLKDLKKLEYKID